MLEEKIDNLIQSLDLLTAVVDRLWQQKDDIRAEPPKTEKPKTEKKKTKKETKPSNNVPEVKDLEAMCLDIIREHGPTFKKKIKNTIKAHGGEMVADCPVDNLGTLKVALEALL